MSGGPPVRAPRTWLHVAVPAVAVLVVIATMIVTATRPDPASRVAAAIVAGAVAVGALGWRHPFGAIVLAPVAVAGVPRAIAGQDPAEVPADACWGACVADRAWWAANVEPLLWTAFAGAAAIFAIWYAWGAARFVRWARGR